MTEQTIENWKNDSATDAQRKKLFALLNEHQIDKELFELTAQVDISTMTKGQMSDAIGLMGSSSDIVQALGKWAATREDETAPPKATKKEQSAKEQKKEPEPTHTEQHAELQAVSTMPVMSGMASIMSLDDAIKLYDLFETAKRKLLKPSDFQEVVKKSTGKVVGRFIKKSGWKKIQTFFGVSTAVISVEVSADEDGDAYAIVKARASWNGRSAEETGIYTKKEMLAKYQPYILSNLIATATTRANNRAVSAIVGGGEVSAEEMGAE